jgi:cellulose synthase/poly-beta-1,6-N-acetylglucosamine synthase-like glycosyltransferase
LTHALSQAFIAASPRFAPEPTPLRSVLIHAAVLAVWIALFAASFGVGGVWAWSVGILYITYDTALQAFVAWQTRALLAPREVGTTAIPQTLAVIVAAHNEAAVLPATLRNLRAQTDAPDLVVIADDGSTDATAELLVRGHGLREPDLGTLGEAGTVWPTLRWLRLAHGGKARALNEAMLHVATDIVVTVDADTLLDAGAIAALRRAFAREPALVAATGVLTPVCGPSTAGRLFQWFQTYEYIRNFLSRYAWMGLDSLLLISGAFAGFRRDAVLAVGGFDPDCLVEDYELIHRLRRHAARRGLNWRFRVLGDAGARTEAPSDLGGFLRQRRRWFGGFLQTQFWYRSMVGDRSYAWLGTLMLPVKAIDTLQPLYGLTAFALLVDYAVTGRFDVIAPVSALIGAKIAVDLAFHLWSVHRYRRWVGGATQAALWPALLAALVEPFSFQLLRHTGAAWGWWAFLTGRRQWGAAARVGPEARLPDGP